MKASDQNIQKAVMLLRRGEPIVIPTDTVYGLCVAVGMASSPDILYDIKKRDYGKAVAWLVEGLKSLDVYGKDVPELAYKLAQSFWPGPLTLIIQANDMVPPNFCGPNNTIALRMPDDLVAGEIIRHIEVPLAATSANISGEKPPKTFDEVSEAVLSSVPLALSDNKKKSGVASTVIDCTTGHPIVVRGGMLSPADINSQL